MDNNRGGLGFVTVGQSLILNDLKDDSGEEFRAIWPFIQAADIAFTNLEATILGRHGGHPFKKGLCHAAVPSVLDTLKSIGFNALSLSNNHAFDLGPSGILSTLEAVDERDFLHAGIGKDRSAAVLPGKKVFFFGEGPLRNKDYKNRLAPHLAGRDYGLKILRKLERLCREHGTDLEISNGRVVIVLER